MNRLPNQCYALFVFLCAFAFSPAGLAEVKPLPADYYSKWRGVQDLEVLEKVLARRSWNGEEIKILCELIKSSTLQEIRRNERSRQVWLERAKEKNSGHAAQNADLMLQLNKDLRRQREMIFTSLLQRLPLSNLDENRQRVLWGFGEETEILMLMPAALEAMKKEPFKDIHYNNILNKALQKNLLSGPKGQNPVAGGMVEQLRENAMISDAQAYRSGCNMTAENSVREQARLYLMQMGDEVGRQILETALAKSLDPQGDVTSLSESVAEAFIFIGIWPTSEYLDKPAEFGPNVKRLAHPNMTKLFFRCSADLIRSSRERHGWNAAALQAYLEKESQDRKNPVWAAAAAKALKRAASESKYDTLAEISESLSKNMALPPCEVAYEVVFGPNTDLGKKNGGHQGNQSYLLRVSGEKLDGEGVFSGTEDKKILPEKILSVYDGEQFKSLDKACLRFSRDPARIAAVGDLVACSLPYSLIQFLSLRKEAGQVALPADAQNQELIFQQLKDGDGPSMKKEGLLNFQFRSHSGGEWNVCFSREHNYHPVKVERENEDGTWNISLVKEWLKLPDSKCFVPKVIEKGTYSGDRKTLLPETMVSIKMKEESFRVLGPIKEKELFVIPFSVENVVDCDKKLPAP